LFDGISIESVSASERENMRIFISFLLTSLHLALATDGEEIKINLCCPSGELLTEVKIRVPSYQRAVTIYWSGSSALHAYESRLILTKL